MQLLQKDVAGILGVDTTTVTNWERNRCGPTLRVMPRIVAFLGYEPVAPEPPTLGETIRHYRRLRGISQKELARMLGIDPSTLARCESDKEPSSILKQRLKSMMESQARRKLH